MVNANEQQSAISHPYDLFNNIKREHYICLIL